MVASSTAVGTPLPPHGLDGDGVGAPQPTKCCNPVLVIKLLFFLDGISASAWGRYCTLFYITRGLSTSQIGFIGAGYPIVSFFFGPLWGVVADRTRSRKRVYMLTGLMSAVAIFLLSVNQLSDAFWKIAALTAAGASFSSAGILDAYALDELRKTGREASYGRLRLWTAVSWGVGTAGMGAIADRFGFHILFYLFLGFTVVKLILMQIYIPNPSVGAEEASGVGGRRSSGRGGKVGGRTKSHPPSLSRLLAALLRARVVVFLLLVCCFGAGFGIVDNLLFVYLQTKFGASTFLCGLTVCTNVAMEIPIFYWGEWLKKNLGHQAMIAVALLAYTVRVYGYTLLTQRTYKMVLVLEALHGFTFASMWTATVAIADEISPPEWKTSTMTIIKAVMNCLGGGIGTAAGGLVAQRYGFRSLYLYAAYIFAGLQGLHLLAWMAGLFQFSKGSRPPAGDVEERENLIQDRELDPAVK